MGSQAQVIYIFKHANGFYTDANTNKLPRTIASLRWSVAHYTANLECIEHIGYKH